IARFLVLWTSFGILSIWTSTGETVTTSRNVWSSSHKGTIVVRMIHGLRRTLAHRTTTRIVIRGGNRAKTNVTRGSTSDEPTYRFWRQSSSRRGAGVDQILHCSATCLCCHL